MTDAYHFSIAGWVVRTIIALAMIPVSAAAAVALWLGLRELWLLWKTRGA